MTRTALAMLPGLLASSIAMSGDKIRLRFEKTGSLRFLSHHDLMRCGERMLRRAELPFKMTGGFHPTPRLVFALSLPLGVIGRNEVVELELTQPCDAQDVLTRLNAQAPTGLKFLSAQVVEMRASAVPRRSVYSLAIPEHRQNAVQEQAAMLLAQTNVWAERVRPKPRRVDIRPYLRNLSVESGSLLLDLWVTSFGTARSEELTQLLNLKDILDAGSVLERVELELHDETPQGVNDGPPTEPPQTLPLESPSGSVPDEDEHATRSATWGLSPAGPVVE